MVQGEKNEPSGAKVEPVTPADGTGGADSSQGEQDTKNDGRAWRNVPGVDEVPQPDFPYTII